MATSLDTQRPPTWTSNGHQPGHPTATHLGISMAVDNVVQRPRQDALQRPQLMQTLCLPDAFRWPRGLACAGTTRANVLTFISQISVCLRLWS